MKLRKSIKKRARYLSGVLEYFYRPRLRESWGGPFNGQEGRERLFLGLLRLVCPDYVVETGTFRATTTRFMSKAYKGPIYTVEANPKCAGFSRAALLGTRNVHISLSDSTAFLADAFRSRLPPQGRGMFYLDAHWGERLPIKDELQVIAANAREWVALIDDFQVPGDDGYGYDDYGAAGVLNAEFVFTALNGVGYEAFYPALPSDKETGARRGCAVVACGDETIRLVRGASGLRKAEAA